MPIKVTCEKCGGVLHAPDDAGGKKGRCPNCQNILPIPFDASRAPAFGQPTTSSGPGGPPPGMAFSSPAPAGNPLLPNADTKRPAAPPPFGSGSRADTGATGSSTPGLGLNSPTFGMSPPNHANVQSSMPFGAPRVGPSSSMPIAPERTGWLAAAAGIRWVQTAVVLIALSFIATSAVSIFGVYGGQALAEKPGFLKWESLSQFGELRFISFAAPAFLGVIALMIGRLRVTSVPSSSGAKGTAWWATFYTLLAIVGVLGLIGMAVLGMKDGFVPDIHPKGAAWQTGTPIGVRVNEYLSSVLMPGTEPPGAVQRFGLLALVLCGKFGELFFACTLGRIGASLRDGKAAGRVTGTYGLVAFLIVAGAFAIMAYQLFGMPVSKWYDLPLNTRTAIVGGSVAGVSLIGMVLYIRMLGAVRRACRNAGA